MWLNKRSISYNAYIYCAKIKDDPKIRKHITDPFYAYNYCRNIKDRLEVRKFIPYENDLKYLKRRRKNFVAK